MPDLEDDTAFPIHFMHQKFNISVAILYNMREDKFNLEINKKVFERLPYWQPY